jgi:cysteine desulfurase / selenocysteine lyase
MLTLDALLSDESLRQQEFPVIKDSLFLGHAGVTILPRRVVCVMQDHLEQSSLRMQEYPEAWRAVNETRVVAADLIGAKASEIALIGPTSVGLSLVANGLPWQAMKSSATSMIIRRTCIRGAIWSVTELS